MASNKPAIHVLEIPQNFHPCLRQARLELGSADLHQLRYLILYYIILFYFYWVFLSLVIKLLVAGRNHIPFRS